MRIYNNSNQQVGTEELNSLFLDRVYFITLNGSASASELVISALQPFIPVTIVGRQTFGKPVGQYGFDFCDKVLFPVAFKSVNARGEGDFFDGVVITPLQV